MPGVPAIPDHQISDFSSFQAATSNGHKVAGLYFFSLLDCLVDLAHRVSHDFYARPELFTNLADATGGNNAPILAKLHARYGSDENFLNRHQRRTLYAALFGQSAATDSPTDEEENFPNLRDELLEACATFVETKFGDEVALRENVRQKHRLFKEYLAGLQGASVDWSRDNALDGLTEKVSYEILRTQGVSAVYGIATPPRRSWPYTFDANADKLVEKASKQLMDSSETTETALDSDQQPHAYISRKEIINRQRAAIEGAKAIATVIDVDAGTKDDEIDLMIRKCYTWATALHSLTPASGHEPEFGEYTEQ